MSFLYTSCVLDWAVRFLLIFLLLIKKKDLSCTYPRYMSEKARQRGASFDYKKYLHLPM
jgi:hypothetical protein